MLYESAASWRTESTTTGRVLGLKKSHKEPSRRNAGSRTLALIWPRIAKPTMNQMAYPVCMAIAGNHAPAWAKPVF